MDHYLPRSTHEIVVIVGVPGQTRIVAAALTDPPDDIGTPDGPAHVVERHSCEYGTHRFAHVILQYHGRVVSLLVTANDTATAAAEPATAIPQVIGRPVDGLSVVSVNGSRHAVMLVSDLEKNELTRLAGSVSLPLVQRLGDVTSDRGTPTAWLFAQPIQRIVRASEGLPDFAPLLAERLPQR